MLSCLTIFLPKNCMKMEEVGPMRGLGEEMQTSFQYKMTAIKQVFDYTFQITAITISVETINDVCVILKKRTNKDNFTTHLHLPGLVY